MTAILHTIQKFFARRPPRALRPDELAALAKQLALTEADELSCDDVFLVIDQLTEAVARGEDVSAFMPLVQKHIEACPDCRELFEALLAAIKNAT